MKLNVHPNTKRSVKDALLTALFSLSIGGCAYVDIVKVPTPTQYENWDDDDQKAADSIKGFRFYLPRPFINVLESFPIYSEVYIAEGAVSPDGKYVAVTTVRSNSGLADHFASELQNVEIPATHILKPQPADAPVDLNAGEEGADQVQTGSNPTTEAGPKPDVTPPAEPPQEPLTGQNEQNVTNNNGAFAYQPLRGSIDIAYLPDFDEQYAIQSQALLGNAKFTVNFGQGWSLQGFNSLTDNSQLNNRIFDLLDSASLLAQAKLNALTKSFATDGTTGNQDTILNSGEPLAGESPVPGTIVSLKISVIYYAAKGLYPIIKPRELAAVKSNPLFDLFGNTANTNRDSFTTPVYPYQYISFNTFKVLAIEAVNPSQDPYSQVFSPTGTSEQPRNDSENNPNNPITNPPGDTPSVPTGTNIVTQSLIARLQTAINAAEQINVDDADDGTAANYFIEIEKVTPSTGNRIIVDVNYPSAPSTFVEDHIKTAIKALEPGSAVTKEDILLRPSIIWANSTAAEKIAIQTALCFAAGANPTKLQVQEALIKRYSDSQGILTNAHKDELTKLTSAEIATKCP